jgi:hypothetical protein
MIIEDHITNDSEDILDSHTHHIHASQSRSLLQHAHADPSSTQILRAGPIDCPISTCIFAQTRRQILNLRSPATFILAQREYQLFAFRKKAVIDPVLRVGFAVQSSRLYVDSFVGWVEVDVAYSGSIAGERRLDGYGGKVGRCYQVYILAGVGEKSHPA